MFPLPILLQRKDFLLLGKLIATSVIQGGPGFPVMLPAAYYYIANKEYLSCLTDVPDPLVADFLDHVRSASGCAESNHITTSCALFE